MTKKQLHNFDESLIIYQRPTGMSINWFSISPCCVAIIVARVPSKGQKIGDVKSINCKYKSGYKSCALHQPRHIHTQFGPISSMANKAPAFKSTFDVSTTFICVAMYFLPKSIPSNSNLGQVTNIRTHHTSQPTYLPIDQSVTETLNLIAPSRAVEGEKYTQQRQWDKFVWYCWSE